MSDPNFHPNKFYELISIYKYYIDIYTALYQLKTENEEELSSIYKMIKIDLIDSKKYLPQNIVKDILDIIPYNNRYTKSYLYLVKLIYDDYHVEDVTDVILASIFLFYKEYGIKLNKSSNFEKIKSENFEMYLENTIYRAIMYDNKERFIFFIESEEFDENKKLNSVLYPESFKSYSLLELCCYYGSIDCFKILITKNEAKISQECLQLSFLGRNAEIMNECLKYQKPNKECMKNAIISHNIDFVTFLMNQYNININLDYCGEFKNLESFLVYFDQTHDFYKCFVYSAMFDTPSLSEFFLSLGPNINAKYTIGQTALHIAVSKNSKKTVEFLISHGANINEIDNSGQTALHIAERNQNEIMTEFLISHGANINEIDNSGQTALHIAAMYNSKEAVEFLISHGANINVKNNDGYTALHYAAKYNREEIVELLISHGAIINEEK
ncbi:ankyrin repeat protein, putative [Trichomonas vaginalis G3]|uniref:Ankyrin repeat protein, putative n=1 Tax=Trichomonas vaginalis (strain ATCC PRA-98 / G3) TaxID=412133 RepID=A2EZL8_TRIV3|nr:spectrin binding [Trichomonas vaginalis G3]EAY01926.1 ankyrin repeat protein, putative [Trichomonas vaginalis G3]KAI5485296.1 spectrin binding [Trichomonas vaginalis G3]|eukprot:XP_001330444.1 ankyrin repeat protein [Trichomonas vaginalis G3]